MKKMLTIKMNRMLTILSIFLLTTGLVNAQISVMPGEGTLSAALASAADGDVFQLVNGGEYTETTLGAFTTVANITITVESEDPTGDKPVVKMMTTPSDEIEPVFFMVYDQSSLTLKGIEFDGVATTEYFIDIDHDDGAYDVLVNKIHVQGCHIHDVVDNLINYGGDPGVTIVDSTFIDDTIIEDTETIIYYKKNGANYVSITNSTFANIGSYGIRISGMDETQLPDNTPTVLIDKTTWYNLGIGDDPRDVVKADKGPGYNPWTISNSVFQRHGPDKDFINLDDIVVVCDINHIVFWDITSDFDWECAGSGADTVHNVTDTLRADPLFADAANGDFTLAAGSPALNWAEGGMAVGDPRWTENWVVSVDEEHQVPTTMSLAQNYPNPFNPSTEIAFVLQADGHAQLNVYDLKGNLVSNLVNGNMLAGEYQVNFVPENQPSGIYLYKLETAGFSQTRKMMYIK